MTIVVKEDSEVEFWLLMLPVSFARRQLFQICLCHIFSCNVLGSFNVVAIVAVVVSKMESVDLVENRSEPLGGRFRRILGSLDSLQPTIAEILFKTLNQKESNIGHHIQQCR